MTPEHKHCTCCYCRPVVVGTTLANPEKRATEATGVKGTLVGLVGGVTLLALASACFAKAIGVDGTPWQEEMVVAGGVFIATIVAIVATIGRIEK